MEVCTQHPTVQVHNYLGDLLVEQPLPQRCFGANSYNGRRSDILAILLEYAKRIGVDLRFGSRVTEYWENDTNAGVIVNDERISADLVVGADGVRSLARKLVLVSVSRMLAVNRVRIRPLLRAMMINRNLLVMLFIAHGLIGKSMESKRIH